MGACGGLFLLAKREEKQNDAKFAKTHARKVFEGFLGELFSKSSPKRLPHKSKFEAIYEKDSSKFI